MPSITVAAISSTVADWKWPCHRNSVALHEGQFGLPFGKKSMSPEVHSLHDLGTCRGPGVASSLNRTQETPVSSAVSLFCRRPGPCSPESSGGDQMKHRRLWRRARFV